MQNADGILDFTMSTSRTPRDPRDPRGATLAATLVAIMQHMMLLTGSVAVAVIDHGANVVMQT